MAKTTPIRVFETSKDNLDIIKAKLLLQKGKKFKSSADTIDFVLAEYEKLLDDDKAKK
jgi:hypothetical protein